MLKEQQAKLQQQTIRINTAVVATEGKLNALFEVGKNLFPELDLKKLLKPPAPKPPKPTKETEPKLKD